jgi:hypothetical protein
MKLKTELYPNRLGGITQGWSDEGDLKHDAMVAHALLQALKDMLDPHDRCVVRDRAKVILDGWGYADG